MLYNSALRRVGIRAQIVAIAAIAVGIALTFGAVVFVGLLQSRLDGAATTAATLRARDVATLISSEALPRHLALPGEESALVQVVDGVGTVVAATANIDGEPAVTMKRPVGDEMLKLTIAIHPLDNVNKMRIISINANSKDGEVTVYAGESLKGARETITVIIVTLAIGLILLVALVAGVTWWAVGRIFRPVRTITRIMAEVTASDLDRRVPTPDTRDEIGQLANTVNDTLSRLRTSAEQQRRFIADASHELRGPLAALRADLEISVSHPEQTNWQNVARDSLGDVERLQHLTDDLLLLARLDTDHDHPHIPINLGRIVADALLAIRRQDLSVIATGLDEPIIVDGDGDQLHRMVRNLIENAEEHAETCLDIAIELSANIVRLTVTDDGPGIPQEHQWRVFERFVRLDTARTRDTGGTGLGLAIVHDVVTSHHGTINISSVIPHGTRITVELSAHVAEDLPKLLVP